MELQQSPANRSGRVLNIRSRDSVPTSGKHSQYRIDGLPDQIMPSVSKPTLFTSVLQNSPNRTQ